MKYILKHKLLILIIIFGSFLRLYGLSQNPPSLTSDEAALGYNAYSILKTAKDEHGEFLPIVFQSFGDWKPGLYVYLTVPFVALFGLNEFSTRIVGALSGILAIYLVYLVSNKLFPNKKIGAWSALFLSIMPWHIHFSRGAWEANLSLTLTLAGFWFFLKGLERKTNLVFSAVLFGLTFWSYQGAKLSTALVLVCLVIVFLRKLWMKYKKTVLFSTVVGFLLISPIILSFYQGKVGRLEVFSVFSYPRPDKVVSDILEQSGGKTGSLEYVFYHSEVLSFARGILSRYLNHFSGRFLFFEGDWQSKRHGAPDTGMLLFVDVIFLVAGLVYFSRNSKLPGVIFVFLWLLFSPLPSALSRDQIQAVRSFSMSIPLAILLGAGVEQMISWGFLRRKVPILLLAGLFVFNLVYLIDQYWVHLPKKTAQDWGYGYKQVVENLSGVLSESKEIVVKQDYSQPYIYFLFYEKYDPEIYQKQYSPGFISSKYGDVGLVPKLRNVTFRDINWQDDKDMKGKIFVVDPIKLPLDVTNNSLKYKVIQDIEYPNGNVAYRIFEIL